jgi:hypothetical protein
MIRRKRKQSKCDNKDKTELPHRTYKMRKKKTVIASHNGKKITRSLYSKCDYKCITFGEVFGHSHKINKMKLL